MASGLLLWGCANRGMGPQGGPKDETPPSIVKEIPANGTTSFTGKNITIYFDEYIVLQDVANNVLISPPQKKAPVVRAVGKRVMVDFEEDLRDSTTYIIDFGNAICDNNEKNPLGNYSFAFATGDKIDTLEMSGVVIDAETLNPMSGVYVGVHADLSDTAISTTPFRHIAKTNDQGEFTIKNMSAGSYHLFALNDISKDFLYQPGEAIAFYDTLFTPTVKDSLVVDTLWKTENDTVWKLAIDSISADTMRTIDTIRVDSMMELKETHKTVYEPNGIVLMSFNENKQKQYFQRCKREERHNFTLTFAAPQDTVPAFVWNFKEPNDTTKADSLWIDPSKMLVQACPTNDTITIWIVDSAYIKRDTIPFLMTYMMTDSLFELTERTDTLMAVYRAPKMTDKAKAAMEKKLQEAKLEMKNNASPSMDVYMPVQLSFATPLAVWEPDSMHVYEMKDSVRVPINVTFEMKDSAHMMLAVQYDWKPETSYEMMIDSAAFIDIYGKTMDAKKLTWKAKSLEEYFTLLLHVEPYNPNMMIQLLSDKDLPIRTMRAKEGGVKVEYLKPGSYFLRVYEDVNGDSIWTTGDYQKHLQPEPVYYFPSKLTLKANWDFEETIYYLEKDILEQKPSEIRKAIGQKKK